MIVDVVMPKMGESITEGTILEWCKQAGETIDQDETLLEIGTDKVDSEIPSSAAGTVVEILAKVNDVIEVGVVIARIDTEGKAPVKSESKTKIKDSPKEEKSSVEPETPAPPKPERPKQKSNEGKAIFTPVVLKVAAQENLPLSELDSIQGTGRNGRITKKDLQTYLETRSAAPPTAAKQRKKPTPASATK